MKKFIIAPQVFELFPDLNIGIIYAQNLNNKAPGNEPLKILRTAEAELKLPEPITLHPNIEVWREAYKAFGAKPKKYPSSIEALCRRAAKGDELPDISPAVNLYNALSLKHLFPFGAEDLEKTKGSIQLKTANGSEVCQVLGDQEPKTCKEGEVIYGDELGPICRRFNWREVERCSLSEETNQALFVLENLIPNQQTAAQQALEELSNHLENLCEADTSIYWLNKNSLDLHIS